MRLVWVLFLRRPAQGHQHPGPAQKPAERSVGLREDRHHLCRAAGDDALGAGRKRLVEGDAADRDAELTHRLLGLRLLAPWSLDEAAGLRVVARKEFAELLKRRDVVARSLTQALARLLEEAELDVAEDAHDRLGRAIARDGVAGESLLVAAGPPPHPRFAVARAR